MTQFFAVGSAAAAELRRRGEAVLTWAEAQKILGDGVVYYEYVERG